MTWVKHSLRFLFVTVGIIALTSIGIDATQYLSGSPSALGILADRATEGTCPDGMVFVEDGTRDFCIDAYEASPGLNCPRAIATVADTNINMLTVDCAPESQSKVLPWRFVSFYEAQKLCARSGKRLPTVAEWHQVNLTFEDPTHCTTNNTGPVPTGSTECVSTTGVHDLVGNVWEWVDGSVTDGVYTGRSLPTSGFVTGVDNNGIVLTTSSTSDPTYGNDYAWTAEQGTYGILRGGFFGSGADAGVFAQNLAAAFDLRTSGVGFRCVQDV